MAEQNNQPTQEEIENSGGVMMEQVQMEWGANVIEKVLPGLARSLRKMSKLLGDTVTHFHPDNYTPDPMTGAPIVPSVDTPSTKKSETIRGVAPNQSGT
jgi:hypothetical protein